MINIILSHESVQACMCVGGGGGGGVSYITMKFIIIIIAVKSKRMSRHNFH